MKFTVSEITMFDVDAEDAASAIAIVKAGNISGGRRGYACADNGIVKKHRIPRECLDVKGNLKSDSPCAKKMRETKRP